MNLEQMIQRQQELLNAARAAQRELTAEEQAEFDSLQRSIDAIRSAGGEGNPAPADTGVDAESVRAAERARIRDIEAMCAHFGIEARQYIDNGTSVADARAAVMESVMQRGTPIPQTGRAEVINDEQDKFRAAAADAMIMRSGMTLANPAAGARELMGMSLRDLAIECLASAGETGLNRRSSEEIYNMVQRQFFNPTAAFPAILDNAINKAYVEGHKTVAVTFDKWTKKGTLKDFKTHDNNYLAGPAGEFLEVPEGGEL